MSLPLARRNNPPPVGIAETGDNWRFSLSSLSIQRGLCRSCGLALRRPAARICSDLLGLVGYRFRLDGLEGLM